MTAEQLARYVDGELDAAGIAEVEGAAAADPGVAAALARQRALRDTAAAAFDDVLTEPVPERLLALLRPASPVADIAAARARRSGRMAFVQRWGSLAAMLVAGLVAGRALAPRAADPLAADAGLARGLDGGAAAAIAVGLSYRDRGGAYCRVFRDERAVPAAGIACRSGAGWAVRVVAAADPAPAGDYRTAATELPPAVTATLDATIAGAPLDRAETADAATRGWR